jgi:ribosome assembly protein YihI (activator of Der GTPase)
MMVVKRRVYAEVSRGAKGRESSNQRVGNRRGWRIGSEKPIYSTVDGGGKMSWAERKAGDGLR